MKGFKPSTEKRLAHVNQLVYRKLKELGTIDVVYNRYEWGHLSVQFFLRNIATKDIVKVLPMDCRIDSQRLPRWCHDISIKLYTNCWAAVWAWLSLRTKGVRPCSKDMHQLIGKYIWALRH